MFEARNFKDKSKGNSMSKNIYYLFSKYPPFFSTNNKPILEKYYCCKQHKERGSPMERYIFNYSKSIEKLASFLSLNI